MRVLLVFKDSVAIERLAICFLSAALKEKGHEVRLAIVGVTEHADILRTVEDFQPEVIGYSAMTGEHETLLELNRELKSIHDFYAIMGGPHPTFCPDVIEEVSLDAICTGEGDAVFPEFCRRLEAGEDYWKVSTFNVKHEGEIIVNPKTDLVAELDDLPYPDRQILYDADPQFIKTTTKFFMAARGCPYRCSYCFNVKYNETYKGKGKIIRCRSPEKVIREIEWVMENNYIRHVSFIDDLFILKSKNWIREFAALYKERIGLSFDCTVRANAVRDEVIAILKDAGMTFVWMGVESGDEIAANKILHRDMTNDHIINAANILRSNGVRLFTLNIVGLPLEDPFESDLKTLDLNIKLKPAYGGSSILYPYPGSPIEKIVRDRGYFDGEPKYLETYKRSSMLNFSSPMDRRRIENLHKLFGVIVNFPVLRPFARFFCGLPFYGLYRGIYYLWYGYSYKVKLNPIDWRRGGKVYIGIFFQMLAKS